MPLNKSCSMDGFKENMKQLLKDGYPQPQAFAIAINTLKKACGVDSDERMSVDQVIASGGAKEDAQQSARGVAWAALKEIADGVGDATKWGEVYEAVIAEWPSLRFTKAAEGALRRIGGPAICWESVASGSSLRIGSIKTNPTKADPIDIGVIVRVLS